MLVLDENIINKQFEIIGLSQETDNQNQKDIENIKQEIRHIERLKQKLTDDETNLYALSKDFAITLNIQEKQQKNR